VKTARPQTVDVHKKYSLWVAASRYADAMRISHTFLKPSTLRSVILEFVTRYGTDHSEVEPRIATVLEQLDCGQVKLDFNGETQCCNIVPV
jgi:uncharacterized protein YheU (UPF0270 family)